MNSIFQWSLFKLVEMTIREMNIFIEYHEEQIIEYHEKQKPKRMVVNNEA